MWVVMACVMMLPMALLPIARVLRTGGAHRSRLPTLVGASSFVAGYLATWMVISALAALAQQALQDAEVWMSWTGAADDYVAAVLLLGAGAFQWSTRKTVYLSRCQTVACSSTHRGASSWRTGLRGGLQHGGHCFCCCWALMALMLSARFMTAQWIVALTAYMCLERLVPFTTPVSRAAGVVLAGSGALLALEVPSLLR
jgi:predicted metal-binding membrane protein